MLCLTWYVLQYGRWLILGILRITYLDSVLWWIVGIPIQSFISRSPSLSSTTHHKTLHHHGENTYVGIPVLSFISRSLSRVCARALTLQQSSLKKLRSWGSQTVFRIQISPTLSLHARVHTVQHALYTCVHTLQHTLCKKPQMLGYKYCYLYPGLTRSVACVRTHVDVWEYLSSMMLCRRQSQICIVITIIITICDTTIMLWW